MGSMLHYITSPVPAPAGLGQARVRSLEVTHGIQGTTYLRHHCCLPRSTRAGGCTPEQSWATSPCVPVWMWASQMTSRVAGWMPVQTVFEILSVPWFLQIFIRSDFCIANMLPSLPLCLCSSFRSQLQQSFPGGLFLFSTFRWCPHFCPYMMLQSLLLCSP